MALALATLVSYAPLALAIASFPRIARLSEADVAPFIARVCRVGFAVSSMSAAFLFVAIPIAVPLLFGDVYRPSTVPGSLLVASGILGTQQWLLCRARAARGDTGLLFSSFGFSVVAMIALDLVLIPLLGITGAALASIVAPLAGLVVCWVSFRRAFGQIRLVEYLPGWKDFRLVLASPKSLFFPPGVNTNISSADDSSNASQ